MNYPESRYSNLVTKIDINSITGRVNKWNARDDNMQHYHMKVPIDKDPLYLKLTWKEHKEDNETEVGIFKLMTKKLCDGGYIRFESDDDKNHYRIRFCRENNNLIYIKTQNGEKKIAVGEFLSNQNNIINNGSNKKRYTALDENEIIDIICEYLKKEDYYIKQKRKTTEKGIDIRAESSKTGKILLVEAKGETSSRSGSNRYGKPYTKSQVFDRVAKGILTGLHLLISKSKNDKTEVGLAFPNTKYFQEYLEPIKPIMKQLKIKMFLIDKDRQVSVF